MLSERLTELQLNILEFICEFVTKNGYSPTLAEIGSGVGCAKSTVHYNLKKLKELGLILWDSNISRNVRVVEM